MADQRYTAEQVDAAVAALTSDPERLGHAQELVTHAAPGLQRILNAALDEGGWFGSAHEEAVAKAATAEEVDAAVEALTADPDRFAHAQDVVTHAAPGLQRILNEALHSGGWFSEAHEGEVGKVAALPDEQERTLALRTLLAEETRLGMLVGVAVGLQLARELDKGGSSA